MNIVFTVVSLALQAYWHLFNNLSNNLFQIDLIKYNIFRHSFNSNGNNLRIACDSSIPYICFLLELQVVNLYPLFSLRYYLNQRNSQKSNQKPNNNLRKKFCFVVFNPNFNLLNNILYNFNYLPCGKFNNNKKLNQSVKQQLRSLRAILTTKAAFASIMTTYSQNSNSVLNPNKNSFQTQYEQDNYNKFVFQILEKDACHPIFNYPQFIEGNLTNFSEIICKQLINGQQSNGLLNSLPYFLSIVNNIYILHQGKDQIKNQQELFDYLQKYKLLNLNIASEYLHTIQDIVFQFYLQYTNNSKLFGLFCFLQINFTIDELSQNSLTTIQMKYIIESPYIMSFQINLNLDLRSLNKYKYLIVYIILIVYPVVNYIITSTLTSQSGLIQTAKAQISSNIATFGLCVHSDLNLSNDNDLFSKYQQRFLNVLKQGPTILSQFQTSIQQQQQKGRFNQQLYTDFFFNIITSDACEVLKVYPQYFNKTILNYQRCITTYDSVLQSGLLNAINIFLTSLSMLMKFIKQVKNKEDAMLLFSQQKKVTYCQLTIFMK
ncbi:hypothetical protein ABPG72_019519 [Tetrahymena utriculariae]